MSRLGFALALVCLTLLVAAPLALAKVDDGRGLYGETDDKVATGTGFILIAAFPLLVATLSFIQWRLDKRKEARKKAAKAHGARAEWRGGW